MAKLRRGERGGGSRHASLQEPATKCTTLLWHLFGGVGTGFHHLAKCLPWQGAHQAPLGQEAGLVAAVDRTEKRLGSLWLEAFGL